MQNDLSEFFAMVNFTNPGILGDRKTFRKHYELPILHGREPDSTEKETEAGLARAMELSAIVNYFILRRTNTLLSALLPPKVIQVVCCHLTELQSQLYEHFCKSKAVRTILHDGRAMAQVLPLILNLKKLCNHPKLIWDARNENNGKDREAFAEGFKGCEQYFPPSFATDGADPKSSGKVRT